MNWLDAINQHQAQHKLNDQEIADKIGIKHSTLWSIRLRRSVPRQIDVRQRITEFFAREFNGEKPVLPPYIYKGSARVHAVPKQTPVHRHYDVLTESWRHRFLAIVNQRGVVEVGRKLELSETAIRRAAFVPDEGLRQVTIQKIVDFVRQFEREQSQMYKPVESPAPAPAPAPAPSPSPDETVQSTYLVIRGIFKETGEAVYCNADGKATVDVGHAHHFKTMDAVMETIYSAGFQEFYGLVRQAVPVRVREKMTLTYVFEEL